MPRALDTLLTSPSALRLLRTIVTAPAPPTVWLNVRKCIACTCLRRNHASASPAESTQRRGKREELRRHAEENLKVFGEWRQRPTRFADARALAERLQEEERRNGLDGIYQVWVLRRRHGFDLPIDDTPDAEFLWGTFVKDPQVVVELLDHAADLRKRTGHVYPRLYELCIAHWLPNPKSFRRALKYHQLMRRHLQLGQLPLRHVARITRGRLTGDMYDTLLEMYKDSDEMDLYDEVVPELTGSIARALSWHAACILKGDLPSPEAAASPMVQAFIAHNATSTNPEVRAMATIAGSFLHREEMDQDLLRRLRGRDTAPVRFEDSFCARMFTTRAVPPDAVIKGLALVGVNEIGPQAVRAMASRTDPISDLLARFEELRAAGIALQGCVFSLALEKFTQEKQWFLVRSMLESDQHPDVYEDFELQTKLLEYYLEHQDWDQTHRTLAILSIFYAHRATQAWNLLLQAHIKRCAPDDIFQTLQNMAQHQIALSKTTICKLRTDVLRPRQRARPPIRRKGEHRRGFDDLRFVARMFMFILENRMGYIAPTSWREILRRFGMTGRVRELRRLVHWLFCWYAPPGSIPVDITTAKGLLEPITAKLRISKSINTTHRPLFTRSQTQKNHPLRQLFPDAFQQALLVWGFRAALVFNAPTEQSLFSGAASKKHFRRRFRQKGIIKRLDWAVGLRTLKELRDLGLYVNSNTVVKALQMIFVNLFDRGCSRIKQNRIMKAVNTTTYPEYARQVNEIWGTPLLPDCPQEAISEAWRNRLQRERRVQR